MKIKKVLMNVDILKYSKEADIFLKNKRVAVNGYTISSDCDLKITDDNILSEADFFYNLFSKVNYSEDKIMKLKLWFVSDIAQLFDVSFLWDRETYNDFQEIIDECIKHIHLRVGKRSFILKRTNSVAIPVDDNTEFVLIRQQL